MAGPKVKHSPGGPNVWQLLNQRHPLYSESPDENLARDDKMQDGWLDYENALKMRYGTKGQTPGMDQTPQMDPRAVGEAFQKEVGLQPWSLDIDMASPALAKARQKTLGGQTVMGRYSPSRGKIDLLDTGLPDDQADTLVHELGHAADHLVSGIPDPGGAGARDVRHHAHFAHFEPEMAQVIQAQSAIENGLPVNPGILEKYPFLRNINPRSSNMLANPWTYYGQQLLPKEGNSGVQQAPPQVPPLDPIHPGQQTLP